MRHVRKRDHVRKMTVHTAVRHQSKQMKPVTERVGKGLLQNSVARKFVLLNCLVNSRQVLVNDPAGSQVKVADFGVAHLSFRQTNVASTCAQFGAWVIPVEVIVKWSRREKRCIAIFLALVLA